MFGFRALSFAFYFNGLFFHFIILWAFSTWFFFFFGFYCLIFHLSLEVEETILNLIICFLFGSQGQRFFLFRTFWTARASLAALFSNTKGAGILQAGIAVCTRTANCSFVEVWIKCLIHVELLLCHIEKFKTWSSHRFEGLRLEQNYRFELGVLFEYFIISFFKWVGLKDYVSLVEGVYLDSAKSLRLDNRIKFRHVKFPIVGGEPFVCEV